MPLQERTRGKKRSPYRFRIRTLWIILIVIGSIMIFGAVAIASTDNYNWLLL
jgi:hypothetical protein